MAKRAIDFNSLSPDSRLFLGEGSSEVGLLNAIIAELAVERAQVFEVKGEKHLKTVLEVLSDQATARAALSCLGIVFDANANAKAKLDSIAATLNSCGFDFDQANLSAQGVYSGSLPIGVFISPGNGKAGRIETLILEEVASSSVQPCVEGFAKCVEHHSKRKVDEKGLVQVYLGSFNAAHGIAVAFERRILDIRHNAYADVREMVRQLAQ